MKPPICSKVRHFVLHLQCWVVRVLFLIFFLVFSPLAGKDLNKAQHWMSASALGKEPRLTTLHLSFITASQAIGRSLQKRRIVAIFFAFVVIISKSHQPGCGWLPEFLLPIPIL